MNTRLPILVSLLVLSYFGSQKFFYEPFVVPRLATWQEVPFIYWVISFIPALIICAIAALKCRSSKEWILFCLLGGLALTSFLWILGYLNQPGTHKVIEGGIYHFMFQYFILTVLLFIAVGVFRLIKYVFRVRASAS